MRVGLTACVVLASALLTGVVAPASRAEVSFDFFYSNLSPYGSWLVSARYGHVWQPQDYQPGWNPYYDGHWEYTDLGWAWVSDYAWGAVPYHYGTWTLDPVLGWVWVPGTTWAPAWVVFRTGPDAIGWAPVAPGFAVGVSIGATVPVSGSFLFVSARDFTAPRLRPCFVPEDRARTLVRSTTIVNTLAVDNGIVVNRGPDLRVVERASGRRIRPARIETVARVAPFAGVRRTQLAVTPDRALHGAPAAEPVSARRPLPPSTERAAGDVRAPRGAHRPPATVREGATGPAAPQAEPKPAPKLEPLPPRAQPPAEPKASHPSNRNVNKQHRHDPKKEPPPPSEEGRADGSGG